jgi:2-(1,2-epoxy-1,2-dihydrophenyl)acetyl-CoA isomerase
MEREHVSLEVRDSVATITLNRPEALNALAGSMREDLHSAIQEARESSSVLCITGAGDNFCSGGDVKYMASARPEELALFVSQGKRVVRTLRSLPIPTLASIDGIAAGAGLGLALACDLRIASSGARLGATFARIGLHPDWGSTYSLTRICGPAAARELIFSGRLVEADEALRLGLVHRVVGPADLTSAARETAEALRDAAPLALRWAKKAIAFSERALFEEVLDFEEEAQRACLASEDAREGIRAFVEKRRPSFKGR